MTPIDWKIISDAVSFYLGRGYTYVDVPWIVDDHVAKMTFDGDGIFTPEGTLVGSGEQGFIDRFDEYLTGKWVTCTPCFRSEQSTSDATRLWFMKVELFTRENYPNYRPLLNDALAFMSQYADCEVCENEEGYHDILSEGLELGSYGPRDVNGQQWVYGTGVALPRLSISKNYSIS